MGAGMYPSDQLEQLPEPCIPCCLNQGLTEAARRIVDLEEERDTLQTRVEQLTTDLQTARKQRDDAMGRATLAERRAVQAEGRVEMLRKALAVIEGSSCSETRVLEVARAARDALLVEFVEGKGGEE